MTLVTDIFDFLKNSLEGDQAAGDPPPPGELGEIEDIKNKLTNVSVGFDHNGLADWLDALDKIEDARLRETILVRVLQVRAPRIAEALTLVGLIKVEFRDGRAFAFGIDWDLIDRVLHDPGDAAVQALLSRIQKIDDVKTAKALTALLISAPRELLRLEYERKGYASLPRPAPDTAIDLIELVNSLVHSPLWMRLPFKPPLTLADLAAVITPDDPPATDYLSALEFAPAPSLDGFGFELKLSNAADFLSKQLDVGGGFRLRAATTESGAQTFRIALKDRKVDVNAGSTGSVEIALEWQPVGGRKIIGPSDGTRVELGPVRLSLRVQPKAPDNQPARPLFSVRGVAEPLTLVFSTGPLGLLSEIVSLPKEIRFSVDADLAYVQGQGLQTAVADGLPPLSTEFTVPLNLKVGSASAGLTIEKAKVRIECKPVVRAHGRTIGARITVELGAKGAFGPVTIVADGMGAWFGNLDGDRYVGADPPSLIGLSLDAGPISGGGLLAHIGSDYVGALQLKLLGIGVNAFAMLGQADGAASFIGILGIRLPPPGVQIGFGFAITGVGGLVGINRRIDTDVLREQIAAGTATDILFCEDPIRNAVTIVGQAVRLFPSEKGVFLVGPTFRLSWLELLNLDAGLFIELPGPRQIFIAGSARLIVGTESAALVYLRLDFAGGVDLPKSLIWFDAALVNSHVMQVFHITGGVALRIAYGDNGYFLFSVGGFHPAFNPGGLELPRLARAGTSTSIAIAWFKLETYFALTSATFQIGAGVEAGLELGPISAHGWIRFDALVQYHPFYFVAVIDAGFDVELFGESFCGVRLQGRLSGPGPLVVEARASVKLLFVRVSKSITVQLGSDASEHPVAIVDLQAAIAGEFTKAANLRSEGDDPSVVLRDGAPRTVGDTPVVGVVGDIVWEQKRVPFRIDLQRFEGAPLPPGRHILRLSSADAALGEERDWFGTGSYRNLSDAEALNTSRFTEAQSGVRVKLDQMADGNSVPCDARLNLVKLPHRLLFLDLAVTNYLGGSLLALQAEQAGQAKPRPGAARVTTTPELWQVHAGGGTVVEQQLGATQAFIRAGALGGTAVPATAATVNLSGVF